MRTTSETLAFNKSLGLFILQKRKEKNMTLADIAFHADICPSMAGRIERAEASCRLLVAKKIVKSLGFTMEELFEYIGKCDFWLKYEREYNLQNT